MKVAKIVVMLLLLLSIFIPSEFVHADISPPPAPQLGGLEPFEYQATNVQMVYERVEMEIQPVFSADGDYSFFTSKVNVSAYFTMHNNGNISESMQVIFPMESFSNCHMGFGGGNSYTNYFVKEDSFQVVVEGAMVPLQKVTTDHPDKSVQGMGDDCNKMSWIGFDVTFPVDDDVVIKVQYVMETMGSADLMQNIEYILETGAGWAGPIQRGYVIVKFPYVATAENVLSESTPGYQFLYNEVFWSFENLEPTSENNIQVSIVSPETWQRILSLRRNLRENPQLPEKWLELAQIYDGISTWHGSNVRNEYYRQKVSPTYEEGIAHNPNSAMLYSNYAQFVHYTCCFFLGENIDQANLTRILNLVNKALALDPEDFVALEIVDFLNSQNPNFQFTPPATIPATATSLFTATPSITPSITMTPISSELQQPIVVTVIHTKLFKAPTSTQKPAPTATSSPTEVVIPVEKQNEASAAPMIFGVLIVFIAGIGVGTLWSRRTRK